MGAVRNKLADMDAGGYVRRGRHHLHFPRVATDALTLHTQRECQRTLHAVGERSSHRGGPRGVGAGAQAVQPAAPLSLYMLSTREIFLPQNPEGGWPSPVPTCAERAPTPQSVLRDDQNIS
jgi:hypothetical protein